MLVEGIFESYGYECFLWKGFEKRTMVGTQFGIIINISLLHRED